MTSKNDTSIREHDGWNITFDEYNDIWMADKGAEHRMNKSLAALKKTIDKQRVAEASGLIGKYVFWQSRYGDYPYTFGNITSIVPETDAAACIVRVTHERPARGNTSEYANHVYLVESAPPKLITKIRNTVKALAECEEEIRMSKVRTVLDEAEKRLKDPEQ